MACLRSGKVTLVAFVWLFSAVHFQMCFQSTCISRCKVTLVAFVWLFSAVHFHEPHPLFSNILYVGSDMILGWSIKLYSWSKFQILDTSGRAGKQANIGGGPCRLIFVWSVHISLSSDLRSHARLQISHLPLYADSHFEFHLPAYINIEIACPPSLKWLNFIVKYLIIFSNKYFQNITNTWSERLEQFIVIQNGKYMIID